MKFVCDSCKAKYQIGDDKVAGKTLRMKCRRCGHMIQVAATVTESSVSQKLPTEPAAGSAAVEPRHPTPPPGHLDPGPLEGGEREEGATVVRPSPLFLFQNDKKPGAPAAPPAPTPSVTGLPRPGGPRIVPPARPSLRSSPPGAMPNASMPGAPMPGAAAAPGAHSPSAPGLYGGFARAVAAPPTQSADPPLPTEDWYVGVGGVPLGPVRLTMLRDKAAQNQVDADSLVWREGFDEWQPVKSFPALLALVEEARQTRMSRTSLPAVTPPPSAVSPASALARTPAAPGVPNARPGGALPVIAASPAPAIVIPDAAPSLPFDLVRQTPAPGTQDPRSPASSLGVVAAQSSPKPEVVSDPFAPPTVASAAEVIGDPFNPRASQLGRNGAGPLNVGGPAAGAAANGSATNGAANGGFGYGLTTTVGVTKPNDAPPVTPISVPPPAPAKKGLSPAIVAFIAMAAAFGGVAAWALFFRNPKVVYMPAEGGAPTTQQPVVGGAVPPPPTNGTSTATEPAASSVASGAAVAGNPTGGGLRPTGTVKPGETAAPFDTSGFNTGGPGPAPTETSAGGGPLTEGQISGVVSSNTARVRRKCWDQAVAGRSADAPSSVKVTAKLKIAPSGSVSSASASGGNEKFYPGLTSCVQSTVQGWKFPSSDNGGEVVVPFSFNAQ